MFNLKTIFKMSRKARNNKNNKTEIFNTECIQQTEEAPRFIQSNPVETHATVETVPFAVGATEAPFAPIPKTKSTGFWSRIFSSSKKERKESVSSIASVAPVSSQRSFWQRSKSILRPRSKPSNLNRCPSVFIDLPKLKIVGSGSAAQLLAFEDKCEFTMDYNGMLEHIFAENAAFYRGEEFEWGVEYEKEAQVNEDGLVSPASTTFEARRSVFDCIPTFTDNPKLDSPLLPVEEAECFQDCSLSENQSIHADNQDYSENQSSSEHSGSFLSTESAICSLVNGQYSLEGLKSYSTEEVAQMFGLMSVDERPSQTFPDGSVRCLVERENGSIESIRFQNCWKPQMQKQARSEDNLKLTEIQTNEVPQKQMSLKQRCQSLAQFSSKASKADLAASRRRSLGAKVSQIVAMYENVSLQ